MRRRSSAPGDLHLDGRWVRPIALALFVGLLAGCGEAAVTTAPAASSEAPAVSQSTTASASPAVESTEPTTTPEASPTEAPATPAPPTATPTSAPVGAGSAAVCSGSDENRDFFASMAAAVEWTVYCPVLADGWFVDDGRYRLAGGGWLQISYDGPGDRRLILQQGAFCASADGCVPAGRDAGQAAFGDRTGSMIAGDDGTWSVVVDQGANPSWLLVTDGLGEDEARQIAADLQPIEG